MNIGRVIRAWFKGDAEIGAKECRADFGDKFLAGIGFVAETLAKFTAATVFR